MKSKLLLGIVILLLGIAEMCIAQNYNWPSDRKTAEAKNALYSDAIRMKQYQDAVEPLQWLLDNAPELSPSLYINAVKVYESLASVEKDPAKKTSYQEKMLSFYDLRMKYFKDEAKVMDRKAYAAYKIYKDRKDKYATLYQIYEKTFALNKDNVSTNNLIAYMDVIRRYKLSGGSLTDDEVLERYDMVVNAINHRVQKGNDKSKMESIRGHVDKILVATIDVNCDFISNKLGPKLKESPEDVGLAKRIVGLSLSSSCTDKPVFLEAAKIVQEKEPDYGIAKAIAMRSSAAGKFQEAIKYFNEAVELADDDAKKAEIYYDMAVQYSRHGQKANARKYAIQAASKDGTYNAKAYSLIGDLYRTSYSECKKGEREVDDRAIFIAAYEVYQKAGNNKMMSAMKEQFPSAEEMFKYNLQAGQKLNVGCWINTTVTLQARSQ